MEEKFIVELDNGKKVPATPITRLSSDETGIEYFYYSIEEDDFNSSGEVSILASRVIVEDGKEKLVDLADENERQLAYNLFSETYKKIKQEAKKAA